MCLFSEASERWFKQINGFADSINAALIVFFLAMKIPRICASWQISINARWEVKLLDHVQKERNWRQLETSDFNFATKHD